MWKLETIGHKCLLKSSKKAPLSRGLFFGKKTKWNNYGNNAKVKMELF